MKIVSWILPPLLLFVGALGYWYMHNNKPAPTIRPSPPPPALEVPVVAVANTNYQPTLQAQGQIRATQQTNIQSEVPGKIIALDPSFAVGSQVNKGQVLVQLERSRYAAQVAIAKASVTQAQAVVAEEQARATLALDNWKRSGQQGDPPPLVRREPQLKAAKANVQTALSQLQTATLDLAATRIRAPYSGVIQRTNANIGDLVSNTTLLGVILSTDTVEVRIPLASSELALLQALPLPIRLYTNAQAQGEPYTGQVVRREVTIDPQTRQLGVIAEIPNPFSYTKPLLPGQFVHIQLPAKTLQNIAVVPLSAVTTNGAVTLVRDGLLSKHQVELVITQNDTAIVRGLIDGDLLTRTALTNLASGTSVKPILAPSLNSGDDTTP